MRQLSIDWQRFIDWQDPVVFGTGLFVLATIGFAGYLYLRFRLRSERVRRWTRDLRSILDAKPVDASWFGFLDHVDEHSQEVPVLGPAWARFRESLIVRAETASATASRDPGDYFDFWATYEAAGLNPRMLTAVPNILTGAGILGTFLGLTIGLAGLDTAQTDVAKLMEGVETLLSGASLAFLTSIAGMVSSIVFAIGERRRTKAIGGEFDNLVSALRAAFPLRSVESIAEELLAEAKGQRVQLERFNTDFAVSMATALDGLLEQSVVRPLTTGMKEVVESVQGMREDRSESAEHALTSALDSFRDSLQASAGREMSAFQETFKEIDGALRSVINGLAGIEMSLRGTLESVTSKLDEGLTGSATRFGQEVSGAVTAATTLMVEQSKRISETMDAVSKQLEATLDSSARSLGEEVRNAVRGATDSLANDTAALGQALREEVLGVNEQYRGTLEQLGSTADRTQQLLLSVGTMLQQVHEIQSQHDRAIEKFQDAHLTFSAAATPIAGAAQSLAESLKASGSAADKVRHAAQVVESAAKSLEEHSTALGTTWSEYRDRFESVDGSLAKAFSEVNTGAAAFADKIRGYVEQTNNELAKALTQLSGVVGELDSAIEAFAAERGRK